MARRDRGRDRARSLQVVGPDGLPPSPPQRDADPVDDPASVPDGHDDASTGGGFAAGAEDRGHLPVPPQSAGGDEGTDGGSTDRTGAGPRIAVPARPSGPAPRSSRPGSATPRPWTRPGSATPETRAPASGSERARHRAETFLDEDPQLAGIRAHAAEHGPVALGPGVSTALTFLAASTRARGVVEIGTGLGVGTVSLLRGMPAEGIVTSIDVDGGHQRAARGACREAGFASGRVRMITGRALDVLPRLSDSYYELVVVDGAAVEYPRYLAEAVRLLRPGGVVALTRVLGEDWIDDHRERDAVSTALRDTVHAVREDERLAPVMLPLSDGMLCAALR